MSAKIRLYLDHTLGQGQSVPLTRDQAHYLFGVMRRDRADRILVFNGRDGEWMAEVAEAGKRGGELVVLEQTKPLQAPPDLWLLFAPVKKARTDFIVEKAVEMGVARILPVQTEFTNADRIRRDRLQAHAVEAAEQCGATVVPEVADLTRLDQCLRDWPEDRQLLFCDEALSGRPSDYAAVLAESRDPGRKDRKAGPWAILIGPEGGFSGAERTRLADLPFSHAISLGPRILRADTAAVAALALWQRALGDWG